MEVSEAKAISRSALTAGNTGQSTMASSDAKGFLAWLKRLLFSKEKALFARHGNFSAIEQHKEEALCIEHAHLLHASEIDYAVPSCAKERGGIQPGFTFPQRAPDQGGRIAQIHACIITTGLKSRDLRGSDYPAFHIVAEEYKVVASEHFLFLSREIVPKFGFVSGHIEVRGRLTMACGRKALKARSSLIERAFAEIVEDHG